MSKLVATSVLALTTLVAVVPNGNMREWIFIAVLVLTLSVNFRVVTRRLLPVALPLLMVFIIPPLAINTPAIQLVTTVGLATLILIIIRLVITMWRNSVILHTHEQDIQQNSHQSS